MILTKNYTLSTISKRVQCLTVIDSSGNITTLVDMLVNFNNFFNSIDQKCSETGVIVGIHSYNVLDIWRVLSYIWRTMHYVYDLYWIPTRSVWLVC